VNYALRFLGVGNAAAAAALGSSCAVLERDGEPLLMIDCGMEALDAYLARYGAPPRALYLTHTHFDHVGGLERLFYLAYFDAALRGQVQLFVPAALVPWVQRRVGDYPGVLAEGGANWWDAFHAVPHSRGFWHQGLWFESFPVRHHEPDTAFGLALRGSFVYTGDTRPIPEMLRRHAAAGELIAHDCGLVGNPSHSGIDDLEREYDAPLLAQCVLYHYGSDRDGAQLAARGHRIARGGDAFALATPA